VLFPKIHYCQRSFRDDCSLLLRLHTLRNESPNWEKGRAFVIDVRGEFLDGGANNWVEVKAFMATAMAANQ
jgi:hypothetical protein